VPFFKGVAGCFLDLACSWSESGLFGTLEGFFSTGGVGRSFMVRLVYTELSLGNITGLAQQRLISRLISKVKIPKQYS
jgi:hypothetical protein